MRAARPAPQEPAPAVRPLSVLRPGPRPTEANGERPPPPAPAPPDPLRALDPQLAALAGDPYYGGLVPRSLAAAARAAVVAAREAGGGVDAGAPVAYVNPRQLHRILARRAARAKAAAARNDVRVRGAYLHESRHAAALRRPRVAAGRGKGRFLAREQSEQREGDGEGQLPAPGAPAAPEWE